MTVYPLGVEAATGRFLPPLPLDQAAQLARSSPRRPEGAVKALRSWAEGKRALVAGSPADLSQVGWGVIFAAAEERLSELRQTLAPLLDRRREQARARGLPLYREFSGEDGYRAGESKGKFLLRHGVGPGSADPRQVPYYLLLVGGPEAIPFHFQHQLDIGYAVGRLHFEALEEYARYAAAVVAAEQAPAPKARRAVLFGTCHKDDPCSLLSSRELIVPLATRLDTCHDGWQVSSALEGEATKERLGHLMGGAERPDLLFSATHGLLFGPEDCRQFERQGALVCQDWPGPGAGPVAQACCFGAGDLPDDASVAGMVCFQFGCFTAGTPILDEFADPRSATPPPLAKRPFVAPLARRLLGHPGGGALAVVGHVDKAYPCSIEWAGAGRQIRVFEEALDSLLAGQPVGHAMTSFGKRYAELSSDLESLLEMERYGSPADDEELGRLWTASHDARNYAILGDPAVRLPLPEETPSAEALPNHGHGCFS